MFVKPAEGLKVRRPEKPYELLLDEGAEVSEFDMYWHRRLRDGDVVEVKRDHDKGAE